MQPATAKLDAFRVHLLHQRLERVGASRKPFKKVGDDGCCIGIRRNCSLAGGAFDVPVADWSAARINSSACLFRHSLDGFLAQIEAVVARHQDLDAVDELLVRLGIGAQNFALLHQVDGETPVLHIERRIVFQVPIQAIRLLDKDYSASGVLLQIGEHYVESRPAALAGRFDVDEFFSDDEVLLYRVVAQQAYLSLDAVALLSLFLAGHARVKHDAAGLCGRLAGRDRHPS